MRPVAPSHCSLQNYIPSVTSTRPRRASKSHDHAPRTFPFQRRSPTRKCKDLHTRDGGGTSTGQAVCFLVSAGKRLRSEGRKDSLCVQQLRRGTAPCYLRHGSGGVEDAKIRYCDRPG